MDSGSDFTCGPRFYIGHKSVIRHNTKTANKLWACFTMNYTYFKNMSFNMFLKQSDEWNFIMNHIDTVLIQIGILI